MASSRNCYRTPPAYCLVDYDPDGLAIFTTYKYGSRSLAHERDHILTPSLRRIGLTTKDVLQRTQSDELQTTDSLLRLTAHDRRLGIRMLERQCRGEVDDELTCDLRIMLMLNVKCEIQLLDTDASGLSDWLVHKLSSHSTTSLTHSPP